MSEGLFFLRALYGEVVLGVSPTKIDSSTAYIQHLSLLEQSELDAGYSRHLSSAISKGLPSEKDKLEELNKIELWQEKDEAELENQETFLQGLVQSKKNMMLPSQVAEQNKLIDETDVKIRELRGRRLTMLGLTAEAFARKKLNEIYIMRSLFKDRECKTTFFSAEEFEYLDASELYRIIGIFNDRIVDFKDGNIRKIAVSPFFQETFSLCDDNIYHFYGTAICKLSFYQTELARYGRFFKHILHGETKPPQELIDDPDKLIDWYQTSKNAEKMMKAQTGSSVAVVGATQEDLKALASTNDSDAVSIQKLMAGKKKVSGRELMKLMT